MSNQPWNTVQQNGVGRLMMSLFLLLYSIVVAVVKANATSREGESLVERLRVEDVLRSGGPGTSIGWGLVDTTATLGRLFQYHLPGNSFTRYQVRVACKRYNVSLSYDHDHHRHHHHYHHIYHKELSIKYGK